MPDCGVSLTYLVAITEVGATPFSTHCVRALKRSCCGSNGTGCWIMPPNELGPGPAWQCHMPGAMNSRANCCVCLISYGQPAPFGTVRASVGRQGSIKPVGR